ncbi:cupin domain-containing protein [Zhouia sp. PK063]|uniref:cupin domain-containing protein n=1 Tax=Zhouia sp. PK063 TaxID=3373602 RepID=UPI0037A0B39A
MLITIVIALSSTFINAQNNEYNLASFITKGVKATNTHHLGNAWLNFLVEANQDFDQNITQATFSANSTLDWHKHTTPQIIIVTNGKGYYQEKGKEPIIIKKGDVITCSKNIEHWHTSTVNSSVSYIAIYGNEPTMWTEKLSRDYYNMVAQKLKDKK